MRRVPLSTSCCFCFRLHQGFVNIIYFDIARLFWGNIINSSFTDIIFQGILFALITFTKSDVTPVDFTVYSFVLTMIVLQTFYAIRSHNRGLPKNNYKIYKKYIVSKFLYILMNFFQMTFEDAFSCQIYAEQRNSDKCMSNTLALKIFLGFIWTLVEIYFGYIVYCFYMRTFKGYYGPQGYPPIFPDIYASSQNSRLKKGVILEVNGVRTKNFNKELVVTGCLIQENSKNRKVIKKFFILLQYFFLLE